MTRTNHSPHRWAASRVRGTGKRRWLGLATLVAFVLFASSLHSTLATAKSESDGSDRPAVQVKGPAGPLTGAFGKGAAGALAASGKSISLPPIRIFATTSCQAVNTTDAAGVCNVALAQFPPSGLTLSVQRQGSGSGPASFSFPGAASGTDVAVGSGLHLAQVLAPNFAALKAQLSSNAITMTTTVGGACMANTLNPQQAFVAAISLPSCTFTSVIRVDGGTTLPTQLKVTKKVTCSSNGGSPANVDVCNFVLANGPAPSSYAITVSGNQVSPSNFTGSNAGTLVTLKPGVFTVSEVLVSTAALQTTLGASSVTTDSIFTGDCAESNPQPSQSATGTVALGQTKTCNIENRIVVSSATLPSGTLLVTTTVTCQSILGTPNDAAICQFALSSANFPTAASYAISVTGNNPSPANLNGSLAGTTVSLQPGAFTVTTDVLGLSALRTELQAANLSDATFFTGDCSFQPPSQTATGTIAAGQSAVCNIEHRIQIGNGVVPPPALLNVTVNIVCAASSSGATPAEVCAFAQNQPGFPAPGAYTLSASGAGVSPVSFPGSASGTQLTSGAGTVTLTRAFLSITRASLGQSFSGAILQQNTFTGDCADDGNGGATVIAVAGVSKSCAITITITITQGDAPNLDFSIFLDCGSTGGTPTDQAVCDSAESSSDYPTRPEFSITATGAGATPSNFAGGQGIDVAFNNYGLVTFTMTSPSLTALGIDAGADSVAYSFALTPDSGCTLNLDGNGQFISATINLVGNSTQTCTILVTVNLVNGQAF